MALIRTEDNNRIPARAIGPGSNPADTSNAISEWDKKQRAKAQANSVSAETYANAAIGSYQASGSYSAVSSEPYLLRQLPTRSIDKGRVNSHVGTDGLMKSGYGGVVNIPGMTAKQSEYNSEYWLRVNDPNFRQWLISRSLAFNYDLIDKDGNFNVRTGQDFWEFIGKQVANNATLAGAVTPELFADNIYESAGGDALFQKYLDYKSGSGVSAPPVNPITKTTQTMQASMSRGAAEGVIDQLAQNLLGHMASEKELARYRAAINAFLRDNPTIQTVTRDETDPNNVKVNTVIKQGASADDARSALQMRIQRGSQGMAFNAGKMIEQALMMMSREQ